LKYSEHKERKLRRIARKADGHPSARMMVSLAPKAKLEPEALDRIKRRAFDAPVSAYTVPTRHVAQRTYRRVLLPAAIIALLIIGICVTIPLAYHSSVSAPAVVSGYGIVGSLEGKVQTRAASGQWSAARPGQKMDPGSFLRTGDGNATVVFEDGSVMRVTDGTEARVVAVGDSSVKVQHIKGGTYHRVRKGTNYTVVNGGVTLHALGTAFNVENRVPDNLEIVMVENAAEVDIGRHGPIKVDEGEVMVVSLNEKKADKQPVSRERLEEKRLLASAQQDAKAGNSTGIYGKLEVPLASSPEPSKKPDTAQKLELGGESWEGGASLHWSKVGGSFDDLVLLRSEKTTPVFPGDEIARYTDTSITSAKDNSTKQGSTYQYRVAAMNGDDSVPVYSNTIVLTIPTPDVKPQQASIKIVANAGTHSVSLEWSVTGTSSFDGYVLERTLEGAPSGSSAPGERTDIKRFESKNILYSYTDDDVVTGNKYSYRVGLVVDGTVMVYSDKVTVDVAPERKINQ
jgi:FecR protein